VKVSRRGLLHTDDMTNRTERDRAGAEKGSRPSQSEAHLARATALASGAWTAQSPASSAMASCDAAGARDGGRWRR
jgi:hypothetical protein